LFGFGVRHELVAVWREKVWKSLTAPGSVATTLSTWPERHVGERLLVRRIGSGQLRPRAFEFLVEVHEVIMPHMDDATPLPCRPPRARARDGWLLTIAQLPTEDPASRMRVLRTLESLGAAVMREGVFLLPDTPANRQSLQTLAEYILKVARQRAPAARRRRHARRSTRTSRAVRSARRATRT
jgi:hypothetical protein